MAVATQHQYRVVHGVKTIETYTQEEAIEIARTKALESGQEVLVRDGDGRTKARVFVHENAAYVDY